MNSTDVDLAACNVHRMLNELDLEAVFGSAPLSSVRRVRVTHYPSQHDPIDNTYCFMLARRDPRVEDHSQMEVLLTCRIDMPALSFEDDKVNGRLEKLWVDGGGWLWSIAKTFVLAALSPEEEE